MSLLLYGAGITFALATLVNAKAAISYASYIILIRGLSFVCIKITESANKPYSQLIDGAGWMLAGTSCIGIVKLAIYGIAKVGEVLASIGNFFASIVNGIADFLDKITFWN